MLSDLAAWVASIIEQVISTMGYAGIALVMLVENLFPPIPSELVMPFAGFLVAQGKMNLWAVLLSGTLGTVAGALVLYYFGVWADETIVRRFVRRYGRWLTVSENELDRALGFFAKHGQPVVFFGRLVPIIRSLISVPAGMKRMSLGRFLLFTTLGTTLWNLGLTLAGVWLGANWEDILGFLKTYQNLTLATSALAVIMFFVLRARRARRLV
jgi:membrane protein DedA with SNARE-associated domain